MRTVAALWAASLLLAGCSGPDAPPEPVRLTSIQIDGLDVVQVGGGADVDYIIDSLGCGAAWLDHDNDGDPDLYLVQGATAGAPHDGPPDRLLRNDGKQGFVDITASAGLGDTSWSFGAAVADYDNDGDPDLYLTNWGPNRLYRNEGDGRFTEVAVEAGVADPGFGVSAVWSDVDRDGHLDLYVVNYVEFAFERYPGRGEEPAGGVPRCVWRGIEVFCGPRNLEPAADRFYRNLGNGSFVDATADAGLDLPDRYYGLAAQFFDADGDGDDDLYVANDSVRNLYFVNRGDGRFDETAILGGLAYNEQGHEQAGMGVAAGDYDGDGRIDLAVTNFSHDHDTLYRNEGELWFSDVSYPAGIGSPSYLALGWATSFVDLDHDGLEDLLFARGHVYPQVDGQELGTRFAQANGIFRNRGDGTFEDLTAAGLSSEPVRSSRSLAPVDLDGDGDLDLLYTHLNDTPTLLRNDGAPGHWLQVRAIGERSNRDGIGARVIVRVGERRWLREIRRNTGYLGSTLPVAHFGLGDARRIDLLEVHWPSGEVDRRVDLDTDQLIEIFEGANRAGIGEAPTLE